MKQPRPSRLLFQLFLNRFFENDSVSPGGGFQTNIYQVLGFLVAAGLFLTYGLAVLFTEYSHKASAGPGLEWKLRSIRLLMPAFSFAVIGFATFFEWDTLFPDRRDFLILTPFPIRLRDLLAAKFAALLFFLLLLIGALNLFPTLLALVMSVTGGLHPAIAQVTSSAGAAMFAFFAVAAFQGILINLTSPRIFRRVSPWIQMAGMSLMVLSLLTFPIYSAFLRPSVEQHRLWLWFFPPVWFVVIPGIFAVRMLVIACALFLLTWTLGFPRHYTRTLENEDTLPRIPASRGSHRAIRSPEECAIYRFSGKTLARSRTHQLFLSTYISAGIAIALLFALGIQGGNIVVLRDGARSLPFFITFFVISGFRAVFQFPAELRSNWLFRLTEAQWAETSRSATRKRALVSGLIPALLFLLPFESALWDWPRALLHIALQLTAGALLIEIMFWNFDKVPFTCSYFPGKTNLSVLVVLYLYGFTNYSFQMAEFELAMETQWRYGLLFFAVSAALLALSWRHHNATSAVRFDAEEPAIQTLDLT